MYANFPVSAITYEEGYRKITDEDLAHAVNGAAWWLEKILGRSNYIDTLAYMGLNDGFTTYYSGSHQGRIQG